MQKDKLKILQTLSKKIYSTQGAKITRLLEQWEKTQEYIKQWEKDKEDVKDNIYVNSLLIELEGLEYKTQYLEKKINEQHEVFKLLYKQIGKYIEPKPQQDSREKVLYKYDFEVSKQYIQIIFDDINNLLFDNSNLYKWECILNCEPLPDPIKLKEKISIKDLRYFLDRLVKAEVIDSKYLTSVEEIKAFEYNNIYITAKQLKDANQDLKKAESKIKTEIDHFFKRIE